MLKKSKSLYQVKLILDVLPNEEYKKIPKEIIEYIEENMEYDQNISIDSTKPLEQQRIDDQTYQVLDEIIKRIEKKENERKIEEYVDQAKKQNEFFYTKIENIRLNKEINKQNKEKEIIVKAKKLLEEYNDILKEKNKEIESLRKSNEHLMKTVQKMPMFLVKIFCRKEEK